MSIVITILNIFFILLLLYQIFLAYDSSNNIIIESLENMSYKEYDTNNPNNIMILTQQNSGNIQYLKQQIDSLLKLQKQVSDISGNVVSLQEQVQGIISAQKDYANKQLPLETPIISGT